MRLYDECHAVYPPKTPTTQNLIDTFLEIVQDANHGMGEERHIYVMIDGLDEIPFESKDRQDVLDFLSNLSGMNLDHISLLATSRDQPDIQEAFTEPVAWSQTTMYPNKVQQDIDTYVSQTLQSNRRLKRLSSEVKETIKAEIGNRADGM